MPKTASPKRTALGKSKSPRRSPMGKMGPRPKHKGPAMNAYMAKLRGMRKKKPTKKSPTRKSKKTRKSPGRKSKKSKKSRK